MAPSDNAATKVRDALQQSLTDEETVVESAPAGLDAALKDLDVDQVAIRFLKLSLQVWYAYFRATSRNDCIGLLADALSPSTLDSIATDLSATVPHQSVTDRIKRSFKVARRGKDRTGK